MSEAITVGSIMDELRKIRANDSEAYKRVRAEYGPEYARAWLSGRRNLLASLVELVCE